MSNYFGHFNTLNCNKKYEVRITASGDSTDYKEIPLAGDSPFTVIYNTSNTPFDPVRTSRAVINIVYDAYLADALSSCAQGTKVELLNITDTANTVTEWIGYLNTGPIQAGYDSCYETIQLDASDCISSLQYIDYTESNCGSTVNIKDIIAQICDATVELEGFYWTRSKKYNASNGAIILPEHLAIAEHNFQYNDTQEEWKLSQVLEEICRYLGFTCLQWGKRMYFIDYQYLETHTDLYMNWYSKASNYTMGASSHGDATYNVTSGSYLSNGATISFEPIYNKIVVNANMYAADDIIPNIFDDKFLTNRISSGDFYSNIEISAVTPDTPSYPHGGTWYSLGFEQQYVPEHDGEKDSEGREIRDLKDSKYRYFQRLYDHKFYDSIYSDEYGTTVYPSTGVTKSSSITKNYRGGTIVDLGVVRNKYMDEYHNYIVPSKLDYTRYLCICELYKNPPDGSSSAVGVRLPVFRLKPNYKPMVMVDDKSYLVLYCNCIFERYEKRNYINPQWNDTECSTNWMAAGKWRNHFSTPLFRIHVGDLGWSTNQNKWVAAGSFFDYVKPEMLWESDKKDYWNREMEILNNVSWEDKLNCEGIKIPLSGIDITQGVEFEILNPDPAFYGNTGSPNFVNKFYEYNAYCWIKDLSLKIVQEGQEDGGNDNDIVYENIIDECSVNDMNEIRVKITTHSYEVKPSYSDMIYVYGDKPVFLFKVYEESLHDTLAQKPEENIIQKYVHQYGTQTKKITLPLSSDITPLQRLTGVDVENPTVGYTQLGTEIDYRKGMQSITAVEKDK